MHAASQLERQWEARKQVALADWLLFTKTDIAAPPASLAQQLAALNPTARQQVLAVDGALPEHLLQTWPTHAAVREASGLLGAGRRIGKPHGEVRSFVLEAERPLSWPRLHAWLAEVRARHGEDLLRLKGVVRVAGEPHPLVLHGVQHLFHPPLALPQVEWPARSSALVFIVRGVDEAELRVGFEACLA